MKVKNLNFLFKIYIHNHIKNGEQDELGNNAIAYLHYFKGNSDFYIIEKDMSAQQLQAYGLANIGYGGELGYISIDELINSDVELDLYFQPVRVKELM